MVPNALALSLKLEVMVHWDEIPKTPKAELELSLDSRC